MTDSRDSKGKFVKGHTMSPEVRAKIAEAGRKRAKPKPKITCEVCGNQFEVFHYRRHTAKFCSKKCSDVGVGKYISSGLATGLPTLSAQGYWFLHYPSHPRANSKGQAKLADLIYEKYHRPLRDNEVVHHKDGCKTNDHPENLQAITDLEHRRHHARERWAQNAFR